VNAREVMLIGSFGRRVARCRIGALKRCGIDFLDKVVKRCAPSEFPRYKEMGQVVQNTKPGSAVKLSVTE
jgi:hypothetical protein